MSVASELMTLLSEGVDAFEDVANLKYLPYKMIWGDLNERFDKEAVRIAVKRAVKRGLVKKRIRKEEVYIAITEFGKKQFINKKKRPSIGLNPSQEGWDGKYRFIIFDIPEKDRIVRDTLRAELKKIAVGWQKSVWVTKANITADFNKFIKENGLEDHIIVIETGEISSSKLDKLLNLKSMY